MNKQEDYIQQLANHIKLNIKKGYTQESLKVSLMNQGYSRISVEKAIDLANKQLAASVPEMKEKPQISYKVEPEMPIIEKTFWEKIKSFFG
jgi:hypothetical protein